MTEALQMLLHTNWIVVLLLSHVDRRGSGWVIISGVTVAIFGFAVGFLIKTADRGRFWNLLFQILITCTAVIENAGEPLTWLQKNLCLGPHSHGFH